MLDIWLWWAILNLAGYAAIISLSIAAYRLRGTTLVAPACWAVVAIVIWLMPLVPTASPPRGNLEILHDPPTMLKLAALCSFCPSMALLGARRPQNFAWQFIVFSFLAIAAMGILPQCLAGDPQRPPHVVWQCFYAVLILLGWVNHLPTRLAWPATLLAAGQILLLQDCLPLGSFLQPLVSGSQFWIAALAIPMAALFAVWRTRRSAKIYGLSGWNRVWLDFRNLFGVVWALRIIERVNALAEQSNVAVRLDWEGFRKYMPLKNAPTTVTMDRQLASDADIAPLTAPLWNLLRRFVSLPWLEARLGATVPTTQESP